jgi:hypothetical protein
MRAGARIALVGARLDRARRAVISDASGEVVHGYGVLLREFGEPVLMGDTSMFSDVQKFYRKRMRASLTKGGSWLDLAFE